MSGKRGLPLSMGSKYIGKDSGSKKQVDCSGKANNQGIGDSESNGSIQNNSDFSKLLVIIEDTNMGDFFQHPLFPFSFLSKLCLGDVGVVLQLINLLISYWQHGVVFALSGFVNPERSSLRSHALEMGAEYRQDWTSDCTLLVCAFSNTPKFRQVESENGTVVSKEWILECYNRRKLVAIEPYLMHAGNPWRKNSKQLETAQVIADQKVAPSKGLGKQAKRSNVMQSAESAESIRMSIGYSTPEDLLCPSKIKEWAIDDLIQTMSWLESQEEKPDPSELKAVAAEGILTCLQDVIESLEQSHDVRKVIEQWKFVPRVAQHLVELEGKRKEELTELATKCKDIYKHEFDNLDDYSKRCTKQKIGTGDGDEEMQTDTGYDSDQTIEMTEEEIDIACRYLPENYE